ncbi:MAG TPA: DUF4350 domain-containing protein [Terriglobales bacterium]|nr:DUF4350 domain-containing protein [Terriglobales bacterium]
MSGPRDLFSLRQLAILITIGTLAMAATVYLVVFGEIDIGRTAGANAFSPSAIGHAAFVELLSRLGIPSAISHAHSVEKAQDDALLLIAEPDDNDAGHQVLQQMRAARNVLVVLPKRSGRADPSHPDWLKSSTLLDASAVDKLLKDIDPAAAIGRIGGTHEIELASSGLKASLDDMQIIHSTAMTSVIGASDGILLGRLSIGTATIWVLADPDLIANHGLGRSDNATVAIDFIRRALPPGGKIIIDEVEHGFLQDTNLLRSLLRPPFIVATVAFGLTILGLFLAGAFRFGGARKQAAGLPPGKLTLINNAAALLASGDRQRALTDRYLHVVFAELAQRLGQTKPLDDTALVAWLDQQAQRQGVGLTASALLKSAWSGRSTPAVMRQVEHWTREMTNGISGHPGIRASHR